MRFEHINLNSRNFACIGSVSAIRNTEGHYIYGEVRVHLTNQNHYQRLSNNGTVANILFMTM